MVNTLHTGRFASVPMNLGVRSLVRIPLGFAVIVGTLIAGISTAALIANALDIESRTVLQVSSLASLFGGIFLASRVLQWLAPPSASHILDVTVDRVRFSIPADENQLRFEELSNEWRSCKHGLRGMTLTHTSGRQLRVPATWEIFRGPTFRPVVGSGVTALDGAYRLDVDGSMLVMTFTRPGR